MNPDQQVSSQLRQGQRLTDRTWNRAITKAAIIAARYDSDEAREIHTAITKLRTQ